MRMADVLLNMAGIVIQHLGGKVMEREEVAIHACIGDNLVLKMKSEFMGAFRAPIFIEKWICRLVFFEQQLAEVQEGSKSLRRSFCEERSY